MVNIPMDAFGGLRNRRKLRYFLMTLQLTWKHINIIGCLALLKYSISKSVWSIRRSINLKCKAMFGLAFYNFQGIVIIIMLMIIIIMTSCNPCTARAYTQHLRFTRWKQLTLAAKDWALYALSNGVIFSVPTITILIYLKEYITAFLNLLSKAQ